MTDRFSSSFPVAPALLALLSACAHHEPAAPAEPVSPAKSAAVPPVAPKVELATPPADPVPPKEPATAAPEPPPKDVIGKVKANLAAAKLGKVKADITSIESALENYAINNSGRYPDTLEPLITPDVNGQKYLKAASVPQDPWGREYVFDPPSPGNPVPKIYTLGRDGSMGGTGEDADVDNLSIRNETPR